MTEQEWLACTDPLPLLEFLRDKASERKLRLFAVACARLVWEMARDQRMRNAIEAAERFADGEVGAGELDDCNGQLYRLAYAGPSLHELAASVGLDFEQFVAVHGLCRCTTFSAKGLRGLTKMASWHRGRALTEEWQPALLRDIFGNPLQPVALAPYSTTAEVLSLAQAIYVERPFPRLSLLADALLNAGCDDEELIQHCRSDGPHVRGCWAVDLILGKS